MAKRDNNGNDVKEKILKTLKEQPIGLTILDLSRFVGAHRQTVAKYVLVLEAQGLIQRRNVGAAVLHYPKGVFLKDVEEKKRRVKKSAKS